MRPSALIRSGVDRPHHPPARATSRSMRCWRRAAPTASAGRSIDFFPSGMSCGGTIALARPGMGYEVRVNWLTGGVEIVPQESCSDGERGFTLIEALVALAIIAAVLSSIGAVIGTTVQGHALDRPAPGADRRRRDAARRVAGAQSAEARPPVRRTGGPSLADRRRAAECGGAGRDADQPLRAARRQHADAGARRPGHPGHHRAARAEGCRMSARRDDARPARPASR